jgi:hypothetical protein
MNLCRTMAQAVSRRTLTAEARVRSRISPFGICGGQKWHWDRFCPEYFGFRLQVSFHRYSTTLKNEKNTNHLHHKADVRP